MRAELVVVAALLCGAAVARGEPNPEAKRLFDEGRALVDQGKAAEACARFAQSYDLEHAPGTMLNLGECAERAGELGRAWSLYDEAAREYDRTSRSAGARFAHERADALAPRLAMVVVRIREPDVAGLTVRIAGGEVAPAAKIVARRDPGPLSVAVSAPGREPYATTITGVAGEITTVEVPRLPLPAAPPVAEASPPSRRGWRLAFWASLATTLAGGTLWYYGYTEIQAAEQKACTAPDSTCNPEDVPDEVKVLANAQGARGQTIALVGIGAVLVGAGAAAFTLYKGYLARDRAGEGARLRNRVAPVVTPSVLGLALAGEF